MTNIRTVATIAFVLTVGSGAAIAISPQEIPAEVKACKVISDDKERLKCFDGLFGEASKPPKPRDDQKAQKPPEEKQANWTIDETKDSDRNPEVVAANLVSDTFSFYDVRPKPPRPRFRPNIITSDINLLM